MSRPDNVDRADQVGIFLKTTGSAGELLLCAPVLPRDMVASRTSPAGILRRYEDQFTTVPGQLVLQLAAKLEPTLIQDGSVQAGLGPHLLARSFA